MWILLQNEQADLSSLLHLLTCLWRKVSICVYQVLYMQ
jgi:hypothetical protein